MGYEQTIVPNTESILVLVAAILHTDNNVNGRMACRKYITVKRKDRSENGGRIFLGQPKLPYKLLRVLHK